VRRILIRIRHEDRWLTNFGKSLYFGSRNTRARTDCRLDTD